MLTRMPEPGPIALVGSGEFLPAMNDVDAALLAATGRPRPRVAILPTASWPDGEEVFRRWAALGVEHFSALGAEVEPVLVRDRFDAADEAHVQAIGEADLVYLSGGKPGHLSGSLVGSPVGDALLAAHRRGAALAGCSAGAMTLTGRHWDLRRRRLFWPVRWQDGLGLVMGATVIPHYDAFPEPMAAMLVFQAPRGLVTLGIDEETAVVGRDGSWQVQGAGRVTVWRGRHRQRYRQGEVFRI
jgi:cyanophycinase